MKHAISFRRFGAAMLCLIFLLSGCAANKDLAADEGAPSNNIQNSSGFFKESYTAQGDFAGESTALGDATADSETPPSAPQEGGGAYEGLEQKLVYTGYLSVETLDFDTACSGVSALVAEFGGLIESSNRSGSTVYRGEEGAPTLVDRYANYVLRIPSDRFSAFMSSAGELGNVTDTGTQLENISTRLYDTQSRLDAYQIQYDRLLALLERADRMEDILAIEAQLTDVRYQIESLTTTLRGWQSQVDYSTVTLNIREVTRYTPPEKQNFVDRMLGAVSGSLQSFGASLADLSISLIYLIPWLAVFALIVWLLRRHLPKRLFFWKGRKTAQPVEPADEEHTADH